MFASLIIMISLGMGMSHLSGSFLRNYLVMKDSYLTQGALNRIKQKVIFDSGRYLVPLGVDGGYHEMPSSMAGVRAGAKGTPFVYCPYGAPLLVSPNHTIKDAAGETYSAFTVTVDGSQYISQSNAPPVAGLLAALILPKNGNPSCSDISIRSDGSWTLSGDSEGQGLVYAIHHDEMMFDGNHGLWLTADSSASLNQAMLDAVKSSESTIVITLKPGVEYAVSGNYTFVGKDPSASVTIKSATSSPSVITFTSGGQLSFQKTSLNVEHVIFSENSRIISVDSAVSVKNSQLGSTSIFNGRLNTDASTFSSGNSTAISLKNSSLYLTGNFEVNSIASPSMLMEDSHVFASQTQVVFSQVTTALALRLHASTWKQSDGNLVLGQISTGGTAIFLDSASALELSNVTASATGSNDAMVYTEGNLVLRNSTLLSSGNAAVYADKTAYVLASSAQLGSPSVRSNVGFWSEGARFSGVVSVYASQCKSGSGFDQSISVSVQDDTVTFANPDGTVVASTVEDVVNIPIFDKINPVQINCL